MHQKYTGRMLKFSLTILLWLVLSGVVGVFGAGVGPGIIMLFYALIVGICASVIACLDQVSIINIPFKYFGLASTILGVILGMTLLHSALENALRSFLLLFSYFILPSYLIHFLVKAINRKLFTEHAA